MTEKLCLKWNDFHDNTNTAFGSLRNDHDFSDITLACEDGQQVEAHKIILAASSPFFHNMLRRNKHPHPLIYMRGVTLEDLVAIVDFLYYGEANVYQENIDTFLAIAEELKLKGLTGNGHERKVEEEVGKGNTVKEPRKLMNNPYSAITENSLESKSEAFEGTVAVTKFPVSGELQELDQKVNSLMSKSENKVAQGKNMTRATVCTVCGKEGTITNIRDHIEANHLEDVSIPCNFCDKTFRTRSAFRRHACMDKF